jgi:hypothetical protein
MSCSPDRSLKSKLYGNPYGYTSPPCSTCLIGPKQKKQSVKNYQKLKKIKDMRKILIIGMVAIAATACNVTRTVTTRSEAWQKGDTSVVIQTKTIETYDASKKL